MNKSVSPKNKLSIETANTRDCEECYPMGEAGDGGEAVGVQRDSNAEGGEESGEAEASRKVLQPRAPTAEERRIHGLTHCPYRSRCEHCVRGQCAEYPHRLVVGHSREVNNNASNYGILSL